MGSIHGKTYSLGFWWTYFFVKGERDRPRATVAKIGLGLQSCANDIEPGRLRIRRVRDPMEARPRP